MICGKEEYVPAGSVNINERISITSTNTYSKCYEFTAPCNGYLDLCVVPRYQYSQPKGSIISLADNTTSYNAVAYNEEINAVGITSCSVSGLYLAKNSKVYVFTKYSSAASNLVDITGRFTATV